jgi:hypothetical protein
MDRIEVYKDVKGYEDYYQVSDMGNVRSKDRYVNNSRCNTQRLIKGKVLAKINYMGYDCVCFLVRGVIKQKTAKVHRMVAQAFIENVDNKPCVNHKDGNKLNNDVDNLEWVTYSENAIHAVENGLRKGENCYKARIVINYNTGIFYTISEVANMLNMNYRTLINKLKVNKFKEFSYV